MKPTWESDCGSVRLYLGDCLSVMPTLARGSVESVVTDPPYGINHVSNRPKAMRDMPINGDIDTSLRDEAMRLFFGMPSIVFGSWRRSRPVETRAVLIWDKGGAVGMGDLSFPWKPSFEEIYVSGDGFSGNRGGAVLRHVVNAQSNGGVNGDGWLHPHEKPISLLTELVAKCPGNVVLDPFMGSGTTGVACVRTGRKFIGIEKEPKYFAIAQRRIQDELRKVAFLEPKPQESQSVLFGEQGTK